MMKTDFLKIYSNSETSFKQQKNITFKDNFARSIRAMIFNFFYISGFIIAIVIGIVLLYVCIHSLKQIRFLDSVASNATTPACRSQRLVFDVGMAPNDNK